MSRYALAKIYEIRVEGSDLCYVGSTTNYYLSIRLAQHRSSWKRANSISAGRTRYMSSHQLFDIGKPYIKLIEEYPCENSIQLRTRERYHLERYRAMRIECINERRPYATIEELTTSASLRQSIAYHSQTKFDADRCERNRVLNREHQRKLRETGDFAAMKREYYYNRGARKVYCDVCECSVALGSQKKHLVSSKHDTNATVYGFEQLPF